MTELRGMLLALLFMGFYFIGGVCYGMSHEPDPWHNLDLQKEQ